MAGLEQIKEVRRENLLEKIKKAGLNTYGIRSQNLAQIIEAGKTNQGVAAGLNNADTSGILLELLRSQPQQVLQGIALAAVLAETDKKQLYLPEKETELEMQLKDLAEQYEITIIRGIMDARTLEFFLQIHLVTAGELTAIEEGSYDGKLWVSTDGKTLEKVAKDTPVSKLVSLKDAKAVEIGYRYVTALEAEELTAEAATNGSIRVLTEKDCMIQDTLARLHESREVSCGKCVFCREGLIQLEYMEKEITAGRGKLDYLNITEEIGTAMEQSSLCSIGQEAAKLALDGISKYKDEYENHIKKNHCPAGQCSSFVHLYIDPFTCTGCGACMDVCPKDCIEGKPGYIHMIDEFDCIKCGKCAEVCEDEAVIQTAGKLPKLPDRLTKAGKFKKH